MNRTTTIISRILDYIEENIKERITLDDISTYIGLSKYHLNRLFKAITDQTLMDYVRNRKLSKSLLELGNTNLKIIDIANEYGFEYEQSYIRSFKTLFKISPYKVRKEKITVPVIEKISLNTFSPVGEDGLLVKPAIVFKPQFYLVGISHQLSCQDNNDFYIANTVANDFFANERLKIHQIKYPNTYIGFIQKIPGITDYKYYIPSLEVIELKNIPIRMTGFSVPSNKYAVFKYIGSHNPRDTTIKNLEEIYYHAFGEWLPSSNYIQSGLYHFERIDTDIATDSYCEVEIYIPIREKEL